MNDEARTTQKLRFAKVHLEELRSHAPMGRGDDFDRAHQEALLAQLFGAYGSFLQELNAILSCGLAIEGVSLGKMRDALKKRGVTSPTLVELYQLINDGESWFSKAKAFRDHTTHIGGIPLSMYVGGPEDGKVAFKDPRSMIELPDDLEATFRTWISEMEKLILRLRAHAS